MNRELRVLCFVFLLSGVGAGGEGAPLKEASLIPQWSPQAQFAGYYLARDKGIYRKHGIDLTIISGGADRSPCDLLEDRKATFGTMWLSTAIEMRARGARVVNIAQTVHRSALMLIAKKSSGIRELKDINNKKIGVWQGIFEIQPRALLKKYNYTARIVPQSYSVNLFLRDAVDVTAAMWYNEYDTILNAGYNADELTTFFFYDYGLNFPEDGIYTLEQTLKNDPTLCRAFVAASIEGWGHAFAHPEEALDSVLAAMRKAHLPANRAHQKWMLERMRDLMVGDDGKLSSKLTAADYEKVAEGLKESGMITNTPAFKSFYSGN